MFQFAGFPSVRYGLAHGCTGLPRAGFPIQRSADHGTCAPPRSLSQLVASFFGSQCQGIRPVLFLLGQLNASFVYSSVCTEAHLLKQVLLYFVLLSNYLDVLMS